MSPVATSDAAFRGGACPTPEYTVTYTGNYTTSADASFNLRPFECEPEAKLCIQIVAQTGKTTGHSPCHTALGFGILRRSYEDIISAT